MIELLYTLIIVLLLLFAAAGFGKLIEKQLSPGS